MRTKSIIHKSVLSVLSCFVLAGGQAASAKEYYMLVDNKDKPITNETYKQLTYCGDGIYLGELRGQHKQLVFNAEGTVLKNPVPSGYWIERVISSHNKEVQRSGDIPADTLFHVSKIGLHGVVDMQQRFILPPEFDSMQNIGDFYLLRKVDPNTSEPLIFLFDPKSRRLSKTGTPASKAIYEQASGGLVQFMPLARRDLKPGIWRPSLRGYCDIDFNVVIPPSFELLCPFRDGLAMVRTNYPKQAVESSGPAPVTRNIFIDKTGKFVAPEIIPMGLFVNGLAVASPAATPSSDATTSVAAPARVGLIDRQFHFVVAPIYESLEPLSGHVYIAKPPGSDHLTAITDNGSKLCDFPKQITKIQPTDLFPTNPELVVAQCNDPSFHSEQARDHDCIATLQGKILVPPRYYLQQIRNGLVQAIDSKPRGDMKSGIMNTKGELVIPLQKADFAITQANRIIKTIQSDNFDPEDWKANESQRLGLFASFLDNFNLIGMPYHQLVELFGQGIDAPVSGPATFTCRYTLMSGTCGNQWNGVDIQFENNIVKAWRFSGTNEDPKAKFLWHVENMIFDPDSSTLDCKLVPKPAGAKTSSKVPTIR